MVRQSEIQKNARDLEKELAWFARVLDTRLNATTGSRFRPQ